jgi:hypothetical protein
MPKKQVVRKLSDGTVAQILVKDIFYDDLFRFFFRIGKF